MHGRRLTARESKVVKLVLFAPLLLLTACNGTIASFTAFTQGKPLKNQRWESCPVTVTATSGTIVHTLVVTVHMQSAKLDKSCTWD